ncbi:MAG: type II secretion system F family protein [Armatimonadota bacterium]
MPLFRYEALDGTGNPVTAYMQELDEQAVSRRLAAQGYRPVSIEVAQRGLRASAAGLAAGAPAAATQSAPAPVSRLSAPERSIARMLHQLHISFRAGMPAYQAVSTVAGQVHDRSLRQVLVEVAQGVQRGERLSDQMERYPRIFSRGDVGTVRAAELGGFLPEAFQALADQHEQDDNTRRRLAIWVWFAHSNVVTLAVLIAFSAFFGAALRNFDVGVGMQAIGSTFLRVSLPILVLYFGGLAYFSHVRRSGGELTRKWHRSLLKLPVIGRINFLRASAVFTRMLERLYHAGVSGTTAWDTAAAAVPNLYLSDRFLSGRGAVETTGRLSAGMEQTGVLEPADVGMVATGETTGDIPQALHYLANRYEEDTRVALGAGVLRGAISFTLWAFLLGAIGFAILMQGYYGQIFKAFEEWQQ